MMHIEVPPGLGVIALKWWEVIVLLVQALEKVWCKSEHWMQARAWCVRVQQAMQGTVAAGAHGTRPLNHRLALVEQQHPATIAHTPEQGRQRQGHLNERLVGVPGPRGLAIKRPLAVLQRWAQTRHGHNVAEQRAPQDPGEVCRAVIAVLRQGPPLYRDLQRGQSQGCNGRLERMRHRRWQRRRQRHRWVYISAWLRSQPGAP